MEIEVFLLPIMIPFFLVLASMIKRGRDIRTSNYHRNNFDMLGIEVKWVILVFFSQQSKFNSKHFFSMGIVPNLKIY